MVQGSCCPVPSAVELDGNSRSFGDIVMEQRCQRDSRTPTDRYRIRSPRVPWFLSLGFLYLTARLELHLGYIDICLQEPS